MPSRTHGTAVRTAARGVATAGAVGVLTTLGVVATAAPAMASENCPPASSPPTANTWYDNEGNYLGTRIVERTNYPNDAVAIQSTVVYETFGHGYRQVETWDLRRHWDDIRVDCERTEDAEDPEPAEPIQVGSGGGGYDGGGFHGGGMFLPGGTIWINPPEERYGTIGEIEPA